MKNYDFTNATVQKAFSLNKRYTVEDLNEMICKKKSLKSA